MVSSVIPFNVRGEVGEIGLQDTVDDDGSSTGESADQPPVAVTEPGLEDGLTEAFRDRWSWRNFDPIAGAVWVPIQVPVAVGVLLATLLGMLVVSHALNSSPLVAEFTSFRNSEQARLAQPAPAQVVVPDSPRAEEPAPAIPPKKRKQSSSSRARQSSETPKSANTAGEPKVGKGRTPKLPTVPKLD